MNIRNANLILIVLFIAGAAGILSPSARSQGSPHGSVDISCTVCHVDGDFERMSPDNTFSHGNTSFPLTGSHRVLKCTECHKDLKFRDTPRDCFRCHEDIHDNELGVHCERCHTPTTFSRIEDFEGFHEGTRFPLRGAHETALCSDCHGEPSDGTWRGLSTACVSCHYDDYRSAEPDHVTAGFGTDCVRCHTETVGFRVLFDHETTGYALTGAHVVLRCADCHSGQFFDRLPTECITCHRDDYTGAPGHVADSFSENCQECHSTKSWDPGAFEHYRFPIYSGRHAGVWDDCSDCHTNPDSHAEFTCFTCHSPNTHSRTYTSGQCYTCHPDGRAEDD